jgi:hypothetical protein
MGHPPDGLDSPPLGRPGPASPARRNGPRPDPSGNGPHRDGADSVDIPIPISCLRLQKIGWSQADRWLILDVLGDGLAKLR